MTPRILDIVTDPGGRDDPAVTAARIHSAVLRAGSRLTIVGPGVGPGGLGSPVDHMLAEIAALRVGVGAIDDGFDAVVLDDPAEPALDALRSRLGIPVTGPTGGALWMGRLLGLPVAITTGRARVAGVQRRLVLAGVDAGTAFVVPLEATWDATVARARERGAATLVAVGSEAEAACGSQAIHGDTMPVLTGTACAIALADVLVGTGLRPSPVGWVPAAAIQDDLLRDRVPAGPDRSVEIAGPDAHPARTVQVIVPHSDMDDDALARRASVISPGLLESTTSVEYTGTRSSPNRADSPYATLLMDIFCFEQGLAAGPRVDAITVDSTTDSGIAALRSHSSALVIGTGSATWAAAAAVAQRFSIVAMERPWAYFYDKNLKLARLRSALASVEAVGTPTDPYQLFEGKEAQMFARLESLGRAAVDEKGAEAIVIGSTTMHQAADHLARTLPVPVLNPGRIALRTIDALLRLEVRQSRIASPAAPLSSDTVFGA